MENKTYSTDIAKLIKKHFEDNNRRFVFDEEHSVFNTAKRFKNRIKKVNIIIGVEEIDYIVYAICPISANPADEKTMAALAEFVCRSNINIKNGCLELNYSNGQIRYKKFVNCKDGLPGKETITESISDTAVMIDRLENSIIDLIAGKIMPEEAAKSQKISD